MSKNLAAIQYYTRLYQEVWQPLSPEALLRYYDRKVIGRSGKLTLNFDEIYQHVVESRKRYAYVQPNFHNIMAMENRIVAWWTSTTVTHEGKPDYSLNTMISCQIKQDKLVQFEFMWDRPIGFVMPCFAGTEKANAKHIKTDLEDRLSRRELECFFHVIQGKTAKQIARELSLSPRTVEMYLDNVKTKLELPTVSHIMEYAMVNGFISVSPLLAQALR